MAFEQIHLDKSFNQSRGTYDIYTYTSLVDDKATILTSGYFAKSRFRDNPHNPMGWVGAVIVIAL